MNKKKEKFTSIVALPVVVVVVVVTIFTLVLKSRDQRKTSH